MAKTDLTKVPSYYHNYISQVPENDLNMALGNQAKSVTRFLNRIPAEKVNYRYARGKWTVKEVLQHIIDCERVFACRAMCIARQDKTNFPSFDENEYADNAKANKRDWKDMIEEFTALRRSVEIMFRSFNRQQLNTTGMVNGKPVYVHGLGFIIAGHVVHHISILKERYLK